MYKRAAAVAAVVGACVSGVVAGAGTGTAAPRSATIAGNVQPWVAPDMDITRARVTYDSVAGYLRVVLTHRAPGARTARAFSERVDLTATSKYADANSHKVADGLHINNSRGFKPGYYLTSDGVQGGSMPVAVAYRGADVTYTVRSPRIRHLALHYFFASANDGKVCESMCMPSGTIGEHRLPF